MKEEVIYAINARGKLLRIIKINPIFEGGKFCYGGIKIEVLKIIESSEFGEEYELESEVYLTPEESLMVGNLAMTIAMECVNQVREALILSAFASNALNNDSKKMYG